jgi:hypothetical protein
VYRQLGTSILVVRAVATSTLLTANIIGSLHLEGLRQAIAKVQYRHPLLNVKIALEHTEISGEFLIVQPIQVIFHQNSYAE